MAVGSNIFARPTAVLVAAIFLSGCVKLPPTSSQTKHIGHDKIAAKAPTTSGRRQEGSHHKHQETHIPITVTDTKLLTTVTIGKKRLLAVVDTGTPNIVISSRARVAGRTRFKIFGRRGRREVSAAVRGADGFITRGRMKYLPEIELGKYTLTNVGGVELDHLNNTSNQRYAILGTNAFSKTVLTIDTRKGDMVVRTEEFDITRQRLKSRGVLVYFTDVDKNAFSPGVPVISAQVEGVPVHLLLDTGLYPMLLTHSVAQKLKLRHECTSTGMTGPFST